MTERQAWLGCLIAGVATLIVVAIIFPLFPKDAAGDISVYPEPIYAFEFARTIPDLIAIFGDVGDPERARRLNMMDRGIRFVFLFMTVYSVFGALFGWAVIKSVARGGWAILIAAIIAGLADLVETSFLLSITSDLRDGVDPGIALDWLRIPVVIKFAGIGIVIVGAATVLMDTLRGLWKLIGLLAYIAGFFSLMCAFGNLTLLPFIGTAIGVGWLLMLAFAAWRVKAGPIPPRPKPR